MYFRLNLAAIILLFSISLIGIKHNNGCHVKILYSDPIVDVKQETISNPSITKDNWTCFSESLKQDIASANHVNSKVNNGSHSSHDFNAFLEAKAEPVVSTSYHIFEQFAQDKTNKVDSLVQESVAVARNIAHSNPVITQSNAHIEAGIRNRVYPHPDQYNRIGQAVRINKINEFLSRPAHELQFAKFDLDERLQMSAWKPETWGAYLNIVPGLENPYHAGVKNPYEIFELFSLYQFPNFRKFVKTLPNYEFAMAKIAESLDQTSLKFDKLLFDKLSEFTVEDKKLSIYFSNLEFVKQVRLQETKNFKETFSDKIIAEQLKLMTQLKWRISNAFISLAQQELKIKQLESQLKNAWFVKKSLQNEIAFLQESNKIISEGIKTLKETFEFSQKQIVDWQDKFIQTLMAAGPKDLVNYQRDLHDQFQKARIECESIFKEYAQIQALYLQDQKNQLLKTEIKNNTLRQSVLKHDIAFSYYKGLTDMMHSVQATIVARENTQSLYAQKRTDVLQNKIRESELIRLSPEAERFIQSAGYKVEQFKLNDTSNHLLREAYNEMLDLLNRAAKIKNMDPKRENIIKSISHMSNLGFQAAIKNDIATTWLLSDFGNAMLDFVTTHAFLMPNAPEQSAAVKSTLAAVESVASYGKDLAIGVYKPFDEIAHLTTKTLKIVEENLAGKSIAESLDDLKSCILNLKNIFSGQQCIGDFTSLKPIFEQVPAIYPAAQQSIIALRQSGMSDVQIESILFKQFAQGLDIAQMTKMTSHEWTQWFGSQIGSFLLFEVALAKAEGIYHLAKGTYVGTKTAIQESLAKAFAQQIEKEEIREAVIVEAGEKIKFVEKANHTTNVETKISFQHFDPSIGNVAKLEEAIEMFKNMPSAISKDGPLTKLLECSKDPVKFSTARGAAYELEVAADLVKAREKIVGFGNKIKLLGVDGKTVINSFEVDIETATKIVECKNWDWGKLTTDQLTKYMDKIQSNSPDLNKLASQKGKEYILNSKYPLPNKLKIWLDNHKIQYIEGLL